MLPLLFALPLVPTEKTLFVGAVLLKVAGSLASSLGLAKSSTCAAEDNPL